MAIATFDLSGIVPTLGDNPIQFFVPAANVSLEYLSSGGAGFSYVLNRTEVRPGHPDLHSTSTINAAVPGPGATAESFRTAINLGFPKYQNYSSRPTVTE